MSGALDGKVAVVTGASRGIGRAIALAMVDAGAKVAIAARKPDGLEAVAAEARAKGGDVLPMACHTGQPEQVTRLFAGAIERFGKVDVLVNNAATNPYFGPMLDGEWAAWDKTFEVNVKGYFSCARELVRHLESRGAPGSIVNLTSMLGKQAAVFQGVYGMTKAAVISMTQTLAAELGSKKIRVNAIAPGLIETRFSKTLIESEMIARPLIERTPLGRVGQPEDIAGAAVFLASDASSFVTGAVIAIDGGVTIT